MILEHLKSLAERAVKGAGRSRCMADRVKQLQVGPSETYNAIKILSQGIISSDRGIRVE